MYQQTLTPRIKLTTQYLSARQVCIVRLTGICETIAKTEKSFQKCETIWKLRNFLEFAEHSNIPKSGKCETFEWWPRFQIWKMHNNLENAKHLSGSLVFISAKCAIFWKL